MPGLADAREVANYTCCGADMVTASMDTVRGILVLVQCTACGRRRWSCNGAPASDVYTLLASAQARPTRHLIVVPPLAA